MKVHPEEVEAVINQHPCVLMARVRGRRSPITGALVVADVVVKPSVAEGLSQTIMDEILEACQASTGRPQEFLSCCDRWLHSTSEDPENC